LLGEVTTDQPDVVGASVAAAASPLMGPAGSPTRGESPDELASELAISLAGFAARLNIANPTPAKQRMKATKTRGVECPD
jgi:hypothetical protein